MRATATNTGRYTLLRGSLVLLVLTVAPSLSHAQDENPFGSIGFEEERGLTQILATGPLGTGCLDRAMLVFDGAERYRWKEVIKPSNKNRLFFNAIKRMGGRLLTVIRTGPLPMAAVQAEKKQFDTVQPLDPLHLPLLKTRNRKPFPRDLIGNHDDSIEALMYFQSLSLAHRTPVKVFLKPVQEREEEGEEVLVKHLFQDPELYQGKVLRFDGYLVRATRLSAPKRLADQGIPFIYETWIANKKVFGEGKVICLMCTALPDGIKPRNEYGEQAPGVSMVGYFFKLYAYKSKANADNPRLFRLAPLMVGHLVLTESLKKEKPDEEDSTIPALAGLAALVGLGMLLVGGVAWWAKRGDSEAAARILAARRRAEQPSRTAVTEEESPPDPGLLGEDWPPRENRDTDGAT